MKNLTYICFVMTLVCMYGNLRAQVFYVDPVKGNDTADGTISNPVASLERATFLTNNFPSKGTVTIRLNPGLYTLKDKLEVGKTTTSDTSWYVLEALVLPDDPKWDPSQMPVIQSTSANNSITQFPHSTGLLIAANRVKIRGLKFIGNPNPQAKYYYPVSRENQSLTGLEITQCYFIGERNSAPIQGAIWAHGGGTKVDHCIFYECKNALLLFKSITGFSVTNSIIYGAYEAAVWFGPFDSSFTFSNNVVSNCNYFWLRPENTFPEYVFQKSIITGNDHEMGMYTRQGLVPTEKNNHKEIEIKKSGRVQLVEVQLEGLPKDYLNLSPQSAGTDLHAGVFMNTPH